MSVILLCSVTSVILLLSRNSYGRLDDFRHASGPLFLHNTNISRRCDTAMCRAVFQN